MKQFLLDYSVLYKASLAFCKKHWIGMLIYFIVCLLLAWTPLIIATVREKIEMRKYEKSFETES